MLLPPGVQTSHPPGSRHGHRAWPPSEVSPSMCDCSHSAPAVNLRGAWGHPQDLVELALSTTEMCERPFSLRSKQQGRTLALQAPGGLGHQGLSRCKSWAGDYISSPGGCREKFIPLYQWHLPEEGEEAGEDVPLQQRDSWVRP